MPASPSEVVVVFEPDRVAAARQMIVERSRKGELQQLRLKPLFPGTATAVERMVNRGETDAQRGYRHEKTRFFSTPVIGRSLDSALDELSSLEGAHSVYWKPGVENPIAPDQDEIVARARAQVEGPDATADLPGVRPTDFRKLQAYLDQAPAGIGITDAWSKPGGRGDGVRVVDIEGGWRFSHTDLLQNTGGLLGGTPYPEADWTNHGTAVLGEIGGDEDAYGICGIAPGALLCGISHGGLGSAHAIELAASKLGPGDVMLLEMHRPGPRTNFNPDPGQKGYIAVEWWPDDLLAIQAAVARGITVIEAAGNGAEDLGDPIYGKPAPGFPTSWVNPFAGAVDSGAIVVGAGAPPGGAYGPDRSRLNFSNWGQRLDCQGWGRSVVSLGYGDQYREPGIPDDQDYWYTRLFSGTSSASPIVAGVAACLSGIAKAQGHALTPDIVRSALRATGSAQQAGTGAPLSQRIGTRPALPALMAHLKL